MDRYSHVNGVKVAKNVRRGELSSGRRLRATTLPTWVLMSQECGEAHGQACGVCSCIGELAGPSLMEEGREVASSLAGILSLALAGGILLAIQTECLMCKTLSLCQWIGNMRAK